MEDNNINTMITRHGGGSADPDSDKSIIIRTTDMVKEYKIGKQKIRAVDSVSLEVSKGEFIALVGVSGSGKSTLLHLLGGLDKATSGEVVVNGQEIRKMSDRRLSQFRNQTIGFVFQSFYLQPFLTLRRNIEVASMPQCMKRAERKQRIEELARQVGLYDRLNHHPRELSGGQIQRAAIARALLNRPAIILADEPTGNLDEQTAGDIIAILKKLAKERQKCVIVVTHSKEVAEASDVVLELSRRSLVEKSK